MAWPAGHTVRWVASVGAVTVTFTTTAVTPDTGTPPTPVTWMSRASAAPNGVAAPPVPSRESTMRAGDRLV